MNRKSLKNVMVLPVKSLVFRILQSYSERGSPDVVCLTADTLDAAS